MGDEELIIEKPVYQIRRARAEDTRTLRKLVRSAGGHPVFSFSFNWRNFYVAAADDGSVIGCVQVKPRVEGIFESASLAVLRGHRSRGIAHALCAHIAAHGPRPQWCCCLNNFVPVYQKFGFVEISDPKRMPAFIRRQWKWFNLLLRQVRKKKYLAAMVLE